MKRCERGDRSGRFNIRLASQRRVFEMSTPEARLTAIGSLPSIRGYGLDTNFQRMERTLCYTKAGLGENRMRGSEFTYKVSP